MLSSAARGLKDYIMNSAAFLNLENYRGPWVFSGLIRRAILFPGWLLHKRTMPH